MRAPALELRAVTKVYSRRVTALRRASFAVAAGERTCLLGPNGAGKTTIVRLLQGALAPTEGDVRLLGVPSGRPHFLAARRQAGIVPQMPGMYDDLLLAEYLELVRRLYECDGRADLVQRLGLEPYLRRPLAALSGGYQRRAVLAAALLPDPQVLILDEPTVGLDPVAAREVREVLREAMAGRTALFCTHNLAEAEALCESAIILRAGEVLLHERIEHLRGRLAPTLRLGAQQGGEALAAALRALGQAPLPVAEGDTGSGAQVQVALADLRQDAPPLLRDLLARGLDVYEAHAARPSLEDLFFHTIQAQSGPAPEDAPPAAATPAAEAVAPAPDPWPEPSRWRQLRALVWKELWQLPRKRSALASAVILPLLLLLVTPVAQMVSLTRVAPALVQSRVPAPGPVMPEVLRAVAQDPSAAFRLMTFPLLVLVGGLIVPSVMASYTVVVERERRTLDLLVALPVSLPSILLAKLAMNLLLGISVTVPLLAVDAVIAGALRLLTLPAALALLVVLLASLTYSTTSALVVSLVAGDFRTANNVSGALIGPLILIALGFVILLPTALAPLATTALLLGLAAVALLAALRWLTVERLLR